MSNLGSLLLPITSQVRSLQHRVDYGWLENPSELVEHGPATWHQIIQSPILISDRFGDEAKYGRFRPDYIYEDSTGICWFSSIAGLANFDPDGGQWCLVSTISGSIVEDNER